MDFSWADDYAEEIRTETRSLIAKLEEDYGTTATVTVEVEPMIQVTTRVTTPSYPQGRNISPIRVTKATSTAKHKPKLIARRIARTTLWSVYGNGNVAPLRTREWYYQTKANGRPYNYSRWTVDQLEVAPSRIERILHPQISARITRMRDSTQDMSPPPEYDYNRGGVYRGGVYGVATNTTAGVVYTGTATNATFYAPNTGTRIVFPAPANVATFSEAEEDLPDDD